ncbi:cyclase family protein [Streptomyces sp. NPDC005492]|uniref:cyclase family protein n=1 Tax=Streptomyces sp. NPDC005492 TaxID=3156883 RepID=UPI0033AB68F1
MTKRWKQRPPGSTWGDWGEDDELGRINLLTPEKVLQGVREVEAGVSFSLSLPLDYPGGSALNQRRYPPILRPTEDLAHKQDVFYNVVAREQIDPQLIDVWSDDVVTLWLQYSTQWDSLAHQGAEFDADGDGVAEAVYYNGFRKDVDIVGPQEDAKGDGSGSISFARNLGLEKMAEHGVQGRGVLIDIAHHLGTDYQPVGFKQLQDIMTADNVVVEPGDMVLLHTGFATQVIAWEKNPDPVAIHQTAAYLDADDPEILNWITESQMSALISDNYAVEGVATTKAQGPHTLLPIHHLCLFKLGVPLGELWYLHDLAAWLREHHRSRFLLTAPPLNLPGTQGSPLTPVATV